MKENPYSRLDKEAYRIAYLIAGFIRNTLTGNEHDELDDWVNASDHNMQLFEELTDERNLEANLAWMDQVQSEKSFNALQKAGAFQKPARQFRLNPVWIAAASAILIAGAFVFYFTAGRGNRNLDNKIATKDTIQILPGGNKATLTLEDGSVIDLTKAKNGRINTDSFSHVQKPADGALVYDGSSVKSDKPTIHTLSTPVGGQYQVTLSDGTKVWLNAATTLKYPSHFPADERRVEVNGEAYFEVAKDAEKPFLVIMPDSTSVKVLGTHFNVMAYENETDAKVTLLEGSVQVKTKRAFSQLEPGTQASIANGTIEKLRNIDIEEATGWKNSLFVFHDAPIESIMRQVERWYDAKVIYNGKINQQFNATIARSEPLSKLLHILELTGYVHFKTENKTIYVLP